MTTYFFYIMRIPCAAQGGIRLQFAPANLERKAPPEPLGKAGGEPERAPRFVPTRVGLRWSRGRGLIRLFSLIACGRGFEKIPPPGLEPGSLG